MSEKSIIIIGAGISGLSAGCYGQMNGYNTRIFEMHNKPGGLCTGWKREGYTIGTSGWVTGSGPANNDFHNIWKELGALQGRTFVNYEEYARIIGTNGQVFTIYTDIDRLEKHMLELAPEDKEVIRGFVKALRAFTRINLSPMNKPPELSGFVDKFKLLASMIPHMGALGKWMEMSLRDFANEFKNPFLREAWGEGVPNVFFFEPDVSILMVLSTFATLHLKTSGYPVGSSTEFVKAIEQRYLDLGGELHYESKISQILVDNDQAVGVRLEDGSEHHSDIVISAADGRTTIFEMLEGKYANDEIQDHYKTQPLFPAIMYISLGVARTFDDFPVSVGGDVFPLDEPIRMEGRECKWLAAHVYNFDPTLAPEGKTRIRIMLESDFGYWKNLRANEKRRYKTEQEEIADQVIAALEKRYPGITEQVEMCDVATPETFERYTGNWRGSYLGWLSTPKSMNTRMSKTLPGLANFYMIGTWVRYGSLAFAAASGRHVTQIICNKDKKRFVTSIP